MARPTDVAHSPRDNTLTITWPDGFRSVYPAAYLRSWCPCAGCQGHGTRVAYREAPAETRIDALWEVGAYALGIKFADGHDSGIYTWSWLRSVAYESPPVGRKLGAFEGGAYSGPVEPPTC
ncbi:MAG: DUF971 domain-containing protein [Enhygromyxa sp.]